MREARVDVSRLPLEAPAVALAGRDGGSGLGCRTGEGKNGRSGCVQLGSGAHSAYLASGVSIDQAASCLCAQGSLGRFRCAGSCASCGIGVCSSWVVLFFTLTVVLSSVQVVPPVLRLFPQRYCAAIGGVCVAVLRTVVRSMSAANDDERCLLACCSTVNHLFHSNFQR